MVFAIIWTAIWLAIEIFLIIISLAPPGSCKDCCAGTQGTDWSPETRGRPIGRESRPENVQLLPEHTEGRIDLLPSEFSQRKKKFRSSSESHDF